MSSSAAFEVLVGTVINGLFANGEVDATEIDVYKRQGENYLEWDGAVYNTDSVTNGVNTFGYMQAVPDGGTVTYDKTGMHVLDANEVVVIVSIGTDSVSYTHLFGFYGVCKTLYNKFTKTKTA